MSHLSLISKINLKREITNDFDPENKFITIAKIRTPHYVNLNMEFAHIVPDYIFERVEKGMYHMGQAGNGGTAMNNLKEYPIIMNKEKAEDKVASLLENGYEIVGRSCMSHEDAIYYMKCGLLKRVTANDLDLFG